MPGSRDCTSRTKMRAARSRASTSAGHWCEILNSVAKLAWEDRVISNANKANVMRMTAVPLSPILERIKSSLSDLHVILLAVARILGPWPHPCRAPAAVARVDCACTQAPQCMDLWLCQSPPRSRRVELPPKADRQLPRGTTGGHARRQSGGLPP